MCGCPGRSSEFLKGHLPNRMYQLPNEISRDSPWGSSVFPFLLGFLPAPNMGARSNQPHLFFLLTTRGNAFAKILEEDGGSLAWAAVQAPVGDIPTARHGHSACEVPAGAGYTAGVARGGGVLVFGGEGRATHGQEIRSTDSHEALLYDPQVRPGHDAQCLLSSKRYM